MRNSLVKFRQMDFATMSRTQLYAEIKKRKLTGHSKKTKEELIAVLLKHSETSEEADTSCAVDASPDIIVEWYNGFTGPDLCDVDDVEMVGVTAYKSGFHVHYVMKFEGKGLTKLTKKTTDELIEFLLNSDKNGNYPIKIGGEYIFVYGTKEAIITEIPANWKKI